MKTRQHVVEVRTGADGSLVPACTICRRQGAALNSDCPGSYATSEQWARERLSFKRAERWNASGPVRSATYKPTKVRRRERPFEQLARGMLMLGRLQGTHRVRATSHLAWRSAGIREAPRSTHHRHHHRRRPRVSGWLHLAEPVISIVVLIAFVISVVCLATSCYQEAAENYKETLFWPTVKHEKDAGHPSKWAPPGWVP
jgi:hypothetical protein